MYVASNLIFSDSFFEYVYVHMQVGINTDGS